MVLLLLIYHFQRRSVARTLSLLAVLAGWGALLSTGTLARGHITALYDFNNVLLLVARVPQIVQSHATRSTGQLSIITYSLNVAGSAARIFTSIQENAGPAMLRGALLSECSARQQALIAPTPCWNINARALCQPGSWWAPMALPPVDAHPSGLTVQARA
jgi:hypothetical protein